MKFEVALIEAQKRTFEMDYEFKLSYFFYSQKWKVKKILDYTYFVFKKNSLNKTNPIKNIIPIFSSNQNHPLERINQRTFITEQHLFEILKKVLNKIRSDGFVEGGYRIESKSLEIAIPLLLYKNLDILQNGRVLIKGGKYARPDFIECPSFFAEVRTILNKGMYGFEDIKIYSNYEETAILRKNLQKDIFIESKESLIKFKRIIVE